MRKWTPSDAVHTDSAEVERLADSAETMWWEEVERGNVDPCPYSATGDALVMACGGELQVYRLEKVLEIGYKRPYRWEAK